MTGVWQTLIPETPSSEPVTPQGGEPPMVVGASDIPISSPPTSKTNNYFNHHHDNGTSNEIVDPGDPKRGPFNRINASPLNTHFWKFYSKGSEEKKEKGCCHDKRKRLLMKSGTINTKQVNVHEKNERYFGDFFTTLVDIRWRYTLICFAISYVFSWLGFAFFWWLLLKFHNDLDNFDDPRWKPCVVGVSSFSSIFLFSLESQLTIGYGYHRMSDECPEAIVLLSVQSIIGILIEALMVGVVLVKLSRPKKRSQTLIFSKYGVICQRDGDLYLMFRVADIRKSMLLETHVRGQVITKYTTIEGEILHMHHEELKVGGFGEDEDRILLFWPTVLVHPIDSESPFYDMSAGDLLNIKLEVILVMEGVVESTGMTTQARTSYLPSEIKWGHQFVNMTKYEKGEYVIDFEKFDATVPVETPLCSAKTLQQIRDLKAEGLSGHEIMSSLKGGKTWSELRDLMSSTAQENRRNDEEYGIETNCNGNSNSSTSSNSPSTSASKMTAGCCTNGKTGGSGTKSELNLKSPGHTNNGADISCSSSCNGSSIKSVSQRSPKEACSPGHAHAGKSLFKKDIFIMKVTTPERRRNSSVSSSEVTPLHRGEEDDDLTIENVPCHGTDVATSTRSPFTMRRHVPPNSLSSFSFSSEL